MITTLLSLIPIFLIGYFVVRKIHPEGGQIERLSLGFGIGTGLFTFAMFVSMALGIRPTLRVAFLVVAISLMGGLWLLLRRRTRKQAWHSVKSAGHDLRLPAAEQAAVAVLVGVIGYLILASWQIDTYWPLRDWDAMTLYDFRGRIFAQTGTLDVLRQGSYYVASPLLTSLAHAWMYWVGDALFPLARPQIQTDYLINGTAAPYLIYWLFYVCLLVAFYQALRCTHLNRIVSLLFVAALASAPMLFGTSTRAMTDIPYTYYLSLGMIYLYLWLKERRLSDIVFAGLLLGLGSWTRSGSEPFVLGAVLLLGIYSWRTRQFRALGMFILLYSIFNLTWRVYLAYGVQQAGGFYEGILGSSLFNAAKLTEVLKGIQHAFVANPDLALSWIFFAAIFVMSLLVVRHRRADMVPLILAVWCALALFAAMYAIQANVAVDTSRYMSHFWPLALYACAVSPFVRFLMPSRDPQVVDAELTTTECASSKQRFSLHTLYRAPFPLYASSAVILISVLGFIYVRAQGGYLGLVVPSGAVPNNSGILPSKSAAMALPPLPSETTCVFALTDGWHVREQAGGSWWNWSPGQGEMLVRSKEGLIAILNGKVLSIRVPNIVDVFLNGKKVASWNITDTDKGVAFSPLSLQINPGDNRIEFVSHNSAITLPTDSRLLAMEVKNLTLTIADKSTACVLQP
jgi:hypothetical protein